jgi:putative membrane protein
MSLPTSPADRDPARYIAGVDAPERDQRDAERVGVDARFLLANERTLLAWVRTALALMAGGGAVAEAATRFRGREALALGLVLLGVAAALSGAVRYRRADRAIRGRRLPATTAGPYLLAGAVAIVGAGLTAAVIAIR